MGVSYSSFLKKVPDQTGKTVLVTGGNSGIGLEACAMFAAKGARVVFTSRSKDKGEVARGEIMEKAREHNPAFVPTDDNVILTLLDLSDMTSVRAFRAQYEAVLNGPVPLDALVLNAGVMALVTRQETKEGFEMQMATNCFGHYVLTCDMMDLLVKMKGSRVVTLASGGHNMAPPGGISFDDLDHTKSYEPFSVYAESKLGNLLFTRKLARLLVEKKVSHRVTAVACHPGLTKTALFRPGNSQSWMQVFGQSPPLGATPTILAATDPKAKQGDYAGPWFFDFVGLPTWGRKISRYGRDEDLQDRFWDAMADKTGVKMTALDNLEGLDV